MNISRASGLPSPKTVWVRVRHKTQAVQMAGAAGNTVLARDFHHQVSFEDLSTGGSFILIGGNRNLLDMLTNFADFFKHESCGFCTPCRVGTSLIADTLHRFEKGQGCSGDLQHLKKVLKLMQKSSFCGLGSSAPTAFLNVLENSPDVFDCGMSVESAEIYFDLNAATAEYKKITEPGEKGI